VWIAVSVASVMHLVMCWLYPTALTTPRITLGDSVNNMVRQCAPRGCKGDNCDLSVYRGGAQGVVAAKGLERRHGGNKMGRGLSGPIYIRGTW
jgi:hypothetical protein